MVEKIKLKIKRLHPEAKLPSYAHPGDTGLDLFSIENKCIEPGERAIVKTGISMEYPEGYCTLIWDKSGLAAKQGITILGGVFEPTYKGEYLIVMFNTSDCAYDVKKGDKIAQLLVQLIIQGEIEEVDDLSESSRGENGLGSTGRS